MLNICGDGYVLATEACDDGNNINGDGCDANCKVETGWTCIKTVVLSVCTETADDGKWMGGLACDDGNGVTTDGCSNAGVIGTNYYCPVG